MRFICVAIAQKKRLASLGRASIRAGQDRRMRKAANIWRRQGASAAHLFAKQDLYEKAQKQKPISAKAEK